MRTTIRAFAALLLASLLTSCGSDQQSGQASAQSYKDTKTIVLDILKTDEAQKAILEAQVKNQDSTTQLLSTGGGQQLQLAVKDILTAPGSDKLLQKTMTDPRFAGEFAKATQANLKQIHKDLLKDPEYQQSLIQTMNNPEYEKMLISVMKGSAYRQQMMNVMQESLQSPLFKVQLIDMLKKVVEEETQPGGQAGQQQGGTATAKSSGGGGGGSSGAGGASGSQGSSDQSGSDGGNTSGKKDTGEGTSKKSDQSDDETKKKKNE